MWTEHRNQEGRTYWFNTTSKESVWEKPDDLKTPFERALTATKWKEYFSGGRKYYYNTETKESKWDMPDELLLLLEKVEKEGQAAPATGPAAITAPGFTPVGSTQGAIVPVGSGTQSSSISQPNGQNGIETALGAHTGSQSATPTSTLPTRPSLPDDPVIPHNGFPTFEEAEKAFMHLLRKAGVDATWTWDQTMRAIITDPLYKALNSLAEKKATWEKYTSALKAKENEEKEARLAKLRPAIRNMLKGNPNVFHYTTFATADKLFSQHPIWQQARIEAERRSIFEEYVSELKQREMQESRASRTRAVSKVVALFKELEVDVVTRWRQAHKLVTESQEWHDDPELRKLPTLDILLAFEDYSRVREREYEEQMRRAQVEKTRKERKSREAFKDLLQGLVQSGQIRARSKWKEVYPSFKDDERYLNILGNPGSNPLELFWDVVDELDQAIDQKLAIIESAFHRYQGASGGGASEKEKGVAFIVGPETTEDQFMALMKRIADEETHSLSADDMHEVYLDLHKTALRKQADERRRAERKQRHLQDDLRYAMRKLSEPLDITLPYEEVIPKIEHLPEYKALEDEEGRRAAFAKFVRRQKEKMREAAASEDGASTTSRKRKEPARDHGDRDREREKDRDRDHERDREREKERSGRDRDRERDRGEKDSHRERDRDRDRGDKDSKRDHDRESRSSRHHKYDDYDDYGRKGSRDYEKDRDRDGYKSSRHHHKDKDDRDDRRREKDDKKHGRDWDDSKSSHRERSVSVQRDDPKDKRDGYDDRDKLRDERQEKRPRYDREENGPDSMEVDNKLSKPSGSVRAETPEEGEI